MCWFEKLCVPLANLDLLLRYPPPSVQQLASDWKTRYYLQPSMILVDKNMVSSDICITIRHIDFPPGMKCKLTSKVKKTLTKLTISTTPKTSQCLSCFLKRNMLRSQCTLCTKAIPHFNIINNIQTLTQLEEESLHCVCEGDLCNEDFIPGNGQNFFNYSTQVLWPYSSFGLSKTEIDSKTN